MSGSRFHPYALEEGTERGRNRKNSGKSATATTSHQATSSIRMLVQSTSSTIKSNKLPIRKPKPVPPNKAAPTALGREAFRPSAAASKSTPSTAEDSRPAPISVIASKSAPNTPVSSRPPAPAEAASKSAPTTSVSSRPPAPTAVASKSAPTTPVSSQPAASVPLTFQRGTLILEPSSTPLPGTPVSSELASYPYWSMAQSLYAMEHQQRIQLQQQVWMQQPNLAYMAGANHVYQRNITQENLCGTSQEYLRGTSQENMCLHGTSEEEYLGYMNELRHMCVLPLVPTPATHLSYFSPIQEHPLNLSLKDDGKDLTHSSQSSSFSSNKPIDLVDCFSPEKPKCFQEPKPSSLPSLKLHPTKPIKEGSLDPEVAKMFPHLRTTDTGSIVLWNFLWALLADNKYKGIIRWIDRPSLQFEVVHPLALAKLWGTVKKNKTMNWQKLMKVINLYLSKNILKQGEDKLKFQFILVPQSPEVKTEKDS